MYVLLSSEYFHTDNLIQHAQHSVFLGGRIFRINSGDKEWPDNKSGLCAAVMAISFTVHLFRHKTVKTFFALPPDVLACQHAILFVYIICVSNLLFGIFYSLQIIPR